MLNLVGQELAKIHSAVGVGQESELLVAKRPRQGWKQVRGSRLVVPNVSATPEAASALVEASLESVKPAVRSPEAGGRNQRGEIGRGRILHGRRQRRLPHGRNKAARPGFEFTEVKRKVFCRLPGVAESGAIEIADDVVSAPGWRSPSTPVRSSVGEIPAQKECILCFLM